MIIKGNPGGNVGFWSSHLLRDDTNELVTVKEITGLLAEDLPTALREMQAIAGQSRSHGNFMYQANINPQADEHLTPEQWKQAIDTLEKNLGLEGHQRVVVEHVKEGRQHYHIIWNRVDVETLKVVDMGGNWHVHMATARELESRFDLTPTPTPGGSIDRTPAQELWEVRAAERSGIDPKELKAELTELWHSSDSGKAFAAALEDRGFILAKGDRRDFCIVDQAGDAHSLARRLDGVTAKVVREHMSDIDRDSLPTVAEARDQQREFARDNEARETDGRAAAVEQHVEPEPPAATMEDQGGAHLDAPTLPKMDDLAKPAFVVLDLASGVVEKLGDFVDGLLGGGATQPPPTAASDQMEQIRAQRRALAALESIRDSIERGRAMKSEDVQNLTPTHLENLKAKGDDYLRSLIENMERDRERENEYGRTRER